MAATDGFRYNYFVTLKRLLIAIFVVIAILAAASAWLHEYAFTPRGRAMTIFTELRPNATGLRAWLLVRSMIIRPNFWGGAPSALSHFN